ncbi:MAG: DNA polymerase III subunit delta [Phycisphaerae bacterium]|nr:DNA polymerase III subunit delta [Phycisphaerae bacterium]
MARARPAGGASSRSTETGRPDSRQQQDATPKPVYAVYGPDAFLRRQAIDQIAKQVLGEDPPPMARVDVNGPEASLADVLDEVRTLSFLATIRMVVVNDADSFITKHREALERYVAEPCGTGVLVLVASVMNRQWRLTKGVEKVGRLIECKAPPPWERDRWVSTRAKQTYGKAMQPADAQTLVEMVGDDMAQLDAELAKLTIYVGDRPTITAADIEALVGFTRPENIFRMTDALADSNAAMAMRVWRQTLATDNQAGFRAIGGIAWAVRQMISAKSGAAARASRSTTRAASRFSLEQLHDMLVQLLAADIASKTGLGTVESAVERFIVRQCAPR